METIKVSESVHQWLVDIRTLTEHECMSVLQNKSIALEHYEMYNAPKTAYECIVSIIHRSDIVSSEFSKIFKKFEKDKWKQARACMFRIISDIHCLLHECDTSFSTPRRYILDHERAMLHCCEQVQDLADKGFNENSECMVPKMKIVDVISLCGETFGKLVDLVIGKLVKSVVKLLSIAKSCRTVISACEQLIKIASESDHLCYLISREGGIIILFSICKQQCFESAWGTALRTVSVICSISESVQELERIGGIEILTDILNNYDIDTSTRAEAAGVIAQITSPVLDHYQHFIGFLENVDDLIRTLTIMCVEAYDKEVFLLAAAAIANITFMDTMACDFLLRYQTCRVLSEACQLNKADTLFAKDQVATIIANMAVIDSCIKEVTDNNGIELLLQFLQESPVNYKSRTELMACERLQQKSAVALARLSKDTNSAQIIIECDGISRLTQLCKDGIERNDSDSVLVACLAALRKIAAVCGYQEFSQVDLDLLIRPRLMESYLMCSRNEESYV